VWTDTERLDIKDTVERIAQEIINLEYKTDLKLNKFNFPEMSPLRKRAYLETHIVFYLTELFS